MKNPMNDADYTSNDEQIADLKELVTSLQSELPAAILEINGGVVNCVTSSVPMRVVILDADTEGGDEDSSMRSMARRYMCMIAYCSTRLILGSVLLTKSSLTTRSRKLMLNSMLHRQACN